VEKKRKEGGKKGKEGRKEKLLNGNMFLPLGDTFQFGSLIWEARKSCKRILGAGQGEVGVRPDRDEE
jgi:hypothetical protein